eukprot:Seg378.9 transcript_id=Seg378.9/GoldUCD/mRNA.D3Y31 product="Neuronal acetylcholine receptor subunit alpha-7" protein_id=Seg378.9/GoldUCD/D3Y31
MEHLPSLGCCNLMCIFVIFLLLFTAQLCDSKSTKGCENSRFSKKGTRPSRSDEQRLLYDLLCHYDKESRPVKTFNSTLVVRFELKLIQVVSVSEKNQEMQTNVWITQTWENQIITWNSSEYNGISNLNIDSQDIWVPTIILYNNADQAFSGGPMKYKTKVILDSHGNHTWFAAVSFKSSCKFDVRYFPFDEQECVLTFGSWAYDSEKLDLIPARSKGDMSDYIQNGEWEIVDVPVTRVKRKYSCCDKTFSEVTYKVRMRRKVSYYLFNMILPCTIIATLAVLAFCINPLSGQRITLSITVMLAMSVFLNFAWTRLPVTSESVPLLAKYYMLTMTEIGLSLFANCISLNYFYRDDALNYMPRFCRVSFIAWLATVIAPLFCMQHPSSTSRLSKIIKTYIEEDETPSQFDTIAGRSDDSDAWNTTNYESVVTIVDTPEDVKTTVRSTPKPRVKVTQLVKRKQQKPMPFKRLFLQEILEHTSTHALTAEPHEHYKNYKEYRKRREEDDIDVLVGSNVEQALLTELKNHKQFAAMIIDRFFLVIFLVTIALSFTTLLSGDTTNYVPE